MIGTRTWAIAGLVGVLATGCGSAAANPGPGAKVEAPAPASSTPLAQGYLASLGLRAGCDSDVWMLPVDSTKDWIAGTCTINGERTGFFGFRTKAERDAQIPKRDAETAGVWGDDYDGHWAIATAPYVARRLATRLSAKTNA